MKIKDISIKTVLNPTIVGTREGGSRKFDGIAGLGAKGTFERSVPGGIAAMYVEYD